MKKILLIISIGLISFLKINANDADLFTYDRTSIDQAFCDLSVLQSYVLDHPALAIVEESANGIVMVNGFKLFTNPFGDGVEPPLGIPSFLWGCVFGVAGLIVVLVVTNNDKVETKKALVGCIVTYLVIGLIYIVAIVSVGTQSNSNYYYRTY